MKRVFAVLMFLLATHGMAAETSLIPARVDTAIHDRIANGEYPAIVIAVVDGDRSGIYSFGKFDNGQLPDANSVFEIGSVTKTFTATLLAEQVVAGKLKLVAPVATLLPGFTLPSLNGKAITLENLATQHSGLPRMPDNFNPANAKDPYVDYGVDRMRTFLAGYTLTREPGAKYEYSNLGAGLLGYALAQHAGTTYEALVKKSIFDPLAMHGSTITVSNAMSARIAPGHDSDGEATESWHLDALVAAGGIRSSGADMLRYLKANMGLLDSPLYPSMQLAQKPRDDLPGVGNRIGLIWVIQHSDTADLIFHNGMTGGYASFIGFTADRRRGVVILTNIARGADDLGKAVLNDSMPLAPSHKRVSLPSDVIESYVGSYQLRPGFVIRIFRQHDQLLSRATGQRPLPIFASATDEFFTNIPSISLSIKRDDKGHVNAIVLHQNGDHTAMRVDDAVADAAEGNKLMPLDSVTLGHYVGHYQSTSGGRFEVTLVNGQLLVKFAGQDALPVYASGKDKFFYRVIDARLDFERDADAKVNALVLHEKGGDARAVRLDETAH